MKIYKTYLSIIFFLFSSFLIFGQSSQVPEVIYKYKNQLNNEWQNIEKEFLGIFGISRQAWEDFKKSRYDQYKKIENSMKADHKKSSMLLSGDFKSMVAKFFASLNIDATNIDFFRNDKKSRLFSTDSGIYLSEERLNQDNLTEDELQVALLHEVQHILNKDHSTLCFLGLYAQENWLRRIGCVLFARYRKKYEDMFMRVTHFREKRADILAGLHGLKYARALLKFYKKELETYEDKDTKTHPRSSARVAYMQKLVDDIQADPVMHKGFMYKQPVKL